MVKKHLKANPGKSLTEILPLAKLEYRGLKVIKLEYIKKYS